MILLSDKCERKQELFAHLESGRPFIVLATSHSLSLSNSLAFGQFRGRGRDRLFWELSIQ